MFGNTKAVDNRSLFSPGIHSCSLPQMIRIDMADLRHIFRSIFADNLFKFLKALGTVFNKLLVDESLFDKDMHHTVGKGHIGTGSEFEMNISLLGKTDIAGIHHYQMGAAVDRLSDLHTDNRMSLLRIGANQHDHIHITGGDIRNRIGHGTRSKSLRKSCHSS